MPLPVEVVIEMAMAIVGIDEPRTRCGTIKQRLPEIAHYAAAVEAENLGDKEAKCKQVCAQKSFLGFPGFRLCHIEWLEVCVKVDLQVLEIKIVRSKCQPMLVRRQANSTSPS